MSRVSRGFRITGWVIKCLFFATVFSVIAFLLWRVFSSGDPKSMKTITPNEKLCAAYERAGGEPEMFRQEQNMITRGEKNAGYFAVTDCVFIPDANQVQVVVRYNNSTVRALAEDYSLEEIPSREAELFDISLTVATDLTPDTEEDNKGNDPESVAFTRVVPCSVSADTKNLYNYRRLVFDLDEAGLSLSDLLSEETLLAVYVDIYYQDDIRYEEPAYGTLCLYDYLTERESVELEARDRKAIEAYQNP
ncbi:MAG: hypothetical protein E7668_01700 [Ruminococcaceae bacterium]|nr:hypothetical protein [Oscillospiraceae bacterium]